MCYYQYQWQDIYKTWQNASIRLYAGLYFDASASLARNQKLSRSWNWKRQGKAGEVVKETVAFLALQSVSAFLSLSLLLALGGLTRTTNVKCQEPTEAGS